MNNNLRYTEELELDLQSYNHDIGRVDTAIEGLQSVMQTQDILTDPDSKLDQTSLRLAEHSVECFLKMARIGTNPNKIIPSNESFNGQYDISHATLEGIGEGIKNVFMSIINAIKKAFQWVWGLIKRLFGRGKDHEETLEGLKHEAEEVKGKIKEMTEEEKKNAPFPRGPDGWFQKVPLSKPTVLKNIVTSKGLMTQENLNHYMGELAHVFTLQPKNVNRASQIRNDVTPSNLAYEVPFHESHNTELVKQVTKKSGYKVHASLEFGSGEFIYIVVPPAQAGDNDDRNRAKGNLHWAQDLHIGVATVGRVPDYSRFSVLEGDHASADKLLEMIGTFNKFLRTKTDEMKSYQHAKERFLEDFEKRLAKNGAGWFSSNEKKTERDMMMFYLKYFKTVMDQPAMMYYGQCDKIISTFEKLAMHVLAYNRQNGNVVSLKEEEVKKDADADSSEARRAKIQEAKNAR
jgi:hypothetical protein